MNDEFNPYPPLDLIEERLFGGADDGCSPEPWSKLPRKMPCHRCLSPCGCASASGKLPHNAPTLTPGRPAGQIWSVAYRGEREGMRSPGEYPCCWIARQKRGGWQGWLVPADPDYASRADVIIDTREFGIAPAACMVQTWNRVEALRDDAAPYLGQLDPDMLAAVRAVAAESPAARPEEGVAGNARAARSRRGRIRPHRPRPGAGPGSALGLPAPLLRIIGHASRVGTRP